MSLIPSCPEVQANLTEYLEGSLPFHKRLGIRLHLAMCRACEGLRKALLALPRLGRQLLDAPAQPPLEAERALGSVLQRLKSSSETPQDGASRP